MPLSFVVTAGNRHDGPLLPEVLAGVRVRQRRGRARTRPEAVAADKAYSSRSNRGYLRARHIRAVIPERGLRPGAKRRARGPRPQCSTAAYKRRNAVERMFAWLKECRRVATRFEKRADHFLAMVKLAAIRLYLRRYFSDTP